MNEVNVLLINSFACFFMTGLIWFVQIVHYPLFKMINPEQWIEFEAEHVKKTTKVVILPMMIELMSFILLLFYGKQSTLFLAINATLIVLIWLSTFWLQVPLHNKLSKEYSKANIAQLVQTNWLRTLLWSTRSALLLYYLMQKLTL